MGLIDTLKERAKLFEENKQKYGWYYSYFEDFVASEGTAFFSVELTDEETGIVKNALKLSKLKKTRE